VFINTEASSPGTRAVVAHNTSSSRKRTRIEDATARSSIAGGAGTISGAAALASVPGFVAGQHTTAQRQPSGIVNAPATAAVDGLVRRGVANGAAIRRMAIGQRQPREGN